MTDLTIERLGHLGDGIGHGPDGPVYAAMTLPGEVVAGEIAGGRMAAPRILTPSPARVAPPCAHFKSCGGCALQHAGDATVAAWKTEILVRALAAHGLSAPLRSIATSPPRSRIRAAIAGRRTKKSAIVGFHGRASHDLVPIHACEVLHPDLTARLPDLAEIARLGASRSGAVTCAVTLADTGVDLHVTGAKPLTDALRLHLPEFADRFVRLTWDEAPIYTVLPPVQTFGGVRVVPPPGAFLQATHHGAATLTAAVAEAVEGARAVADLFCGCGTFTFPLAHHAAVTAIDGDAGAVAALETAARHASGLKPVRAQTRDLFRRPLDTADLSPFDAALLDPPRAGAEAQVGELARHGPPRIAYVSCNPQSFARDAAVLTAGGYRLDWIQPVDQFRWSPHLELAAQFTRDHIGAV